VAAHRDLPSPAAASVLRTAVDGEGKRHFLAFERPPLGKQLFLLDDQWKLQLTYPDDEQTSDGLADAQLCDLDGDGMLEICVGFQGSVGAQGIDLAGSRLWSNRLFRPVLSLVETTANSVGYRKLLATGQTGKILRLNQFGNHDPEIEVAGRDILHLHAARFPAREFALYLGLVPLGERRQEAVALGEKFDEQWSYKLPEGLFRGPIEFVASGQLLNDAAKSGGEWIFAAADGSVHIVSDDGDFNDYFQSGESLTGIAATRLSGAGVLILSSENGVTAWKVERTKQE
jgi:hypothetical protein